MIKIKESNKKLFNKLQEPIKIRGLLLEIRKLLTKELSLSSREAEIESRFILEQALKVNHQYLIKNFDQLIQGNKYEQIIGFLSERISYKPLAYIFKEWKFYDLKLHIDQNVLIPRQDTELLIDLIFKNYDKNENISILDLGTGSGAIGVCLANQFKNSNILASDISSKAIAITKKNISEHKLKNIMALKSNWFSNIPNKKFDLIVSNPPYIDMADPHLENKSLMYEPKNALISKQKGFGDILKIIKKSPGFLKPEGRLYIEHGYNQHKKVYQLFLDYNFIKIEQYKDLNGIIRVTSGKI